MFNSLEGRRERKSAIRFGGQSSGKPNGSICRQGDGRSGGQARREGHGGESLRSLGVTSEPVPRHVSVKEAVFPFRKFAGVDIVLGPEMRSTGEVMG